MSSQTGRQHFVEPAQARNPQFKSDGLVVRQIEGNTSLIKMGVDLGDRTQLGDQVTGGHSGFKRLVAHLTVASIHGVLK